MTTKRWLGNAAAVTDLWTVSLAGTVTSQTYQMTINSKSISYVAGGSDTVSSILQGLANAWNAAAIPEFQELTAAALPVGSGPYTSMTVTQDIAGRPTVITVATGGAATFTITNTIVATGPNFFDNPQNWSTGNIPMSGDNIVFDNGSVGCWYNIDATATVGSGTVNVEQGYSGTIGLPFINANGTTTYNEYRNTSLIAPGCMFTINGPSVRRCNLALGSYPSNVQVLATGTRIDQYTPVVLITGGAIGSVLNITKGDVGVAFFLGSTAYFNNVNLSFASNPNTDVTLWIGSGAMIFVINKNGGNLTVNCNVVNFTQDVAGGTTTIAGTAAVQTIAAYAGTVYLNSTGTTELIDLYGSATFSADGDTRAKTVLDPINVYSTAVTITDNMKTINAGTLSLATNGLTSVNVNHGGNASIVYQ